jgi:hypothetical protein
MLLSEKIPKKWYCLPHFFPVTLQQVFLRILELKTGRMSIQPFLFYTGFLPASKNIFPK